MFNVLQARGVPSKFVMFPDENHVSYDNWKFYLELCVETNTIKQWVLKPENSLVWHREVLDWINKYSGISDEAKLESRTGKLTV